MAFWEETGKAQQAKSCPSTQEPLDDFINKIEADRRSTSVGIPLSSLPSSTHVLDVFKPVSTDDMRNIITGSPCKSCALDPLPTSVLKEFLSELLPFITDLCNSLIQGLLPPSQRHDTITPRLKKRLSFGCKKLQIDFQFKFLSKTVEKVDLPPSHQLSG